MTSPTIISNHLQNITLVTKEDFSGFTFELIGSLTISLKFLKGNMDFLPDENENMVFYIKKKIENPFFSTLVPKQIIVNEVTELYKTAMQKMLNPNNVFRELEVQWRHGIVTDTFTKKFNE